MAILVLGILIKSANSILSENKPKKNNLTPIYQDQTVPKATGSEKKQPIQKPSARHTSAKTKMEKKNEKVKQVKQEDFRTVITVTAKRLENEPTLPEEPKPILSEVIKDLENTILNETYYQFIPSNPENDFRSM